MRIPAKLDKVFVVLRRDLLTALRYRTAFWVQALAMLGEIAGFYYLARAIGPAFRPDGLGYYPFALIGTAYSGLVVAGAYELVTTVHEAQMTGTMEVLMTTSTPPRTILFLNTASSFIGQGVKWIAYTVAGFVFFGVPFRDANLPALLVVLALSMAIAVAIGIVAAAVQVSIYKGTGVVWLVGSIISLLTGSLFPVTALPHSLQKISLLVPFTYSLDALRLSLLKGYGIAQLMGPISALAAYSLVLLPASLALFSWSLRRARLLGTLSAY